MQERSACGPTAEDVDPPPTYPADLTHALQAELAVLADIETTYAAKRHDLETWVGSPKLKERIIRQLEGRHKRDREPHVLRLGELYGRLMNLTMFKGLHTKQQNNEIAKSWPSLAHSAPTF